MPLITLQPQDLTDLEMRIQHVFHNQNRIMEALSDYAYNYENCRLTLEGASIISAGISIAENVKRIQIMKRRHSLHILEMLSPSETKNWAIIEQSLFVDDKLYTHLFSHGFQIISSSGDSAKTQTLFILDAVFMDFKCQLNSTGFRQWLAPLAKPLITEILHLHINTPLMNTMLIHQNHQLAQENAQLHEELEEYKRIYDIATQPLCDDVENNLVTSPAADSSPPSTRTSNSNSFYLPNKDALSWTTATPSFFY